MTELTEDVIAFLSHGTRTAKLGYLAKDGRPLIAPVWFVVDGGQLVFNTGKDTAKGRALARDPRVVICVDDERPPFSFVQVQGTATTSEDPDELLAIAAEREIEVDASLPQGKLVMELFEELVEPTLLQPTFVCDYPAEAQPLARRHDDDPRLIDAWDLIIAGVERATGFTELVDPVVQREVLTQQSLAAAAGDPEAMQLDEDFLRALEYGAPPMGGIGIGIDRMVMFFTGVGIRETILFPHLKPEA